MSLFSNLFGPSNKDVILKLNQLEKNFMSKLSEALDEQTTAINANIDATNDVLTEVRQLIQNGQSAEADALVGKVQENNNLIKTATETLKTVAAEADAENGDPQPTE